MSDLTADKKSLRRILILFAGAAFLAGCAAASVVGTAAKVTSTAVGATADVAGAAVDIATPDRKDKDDD